MSASVPQTTPPPESVSRAAVQEGSAMLSPPPLINIPPEKDEVAVEVILRRPEELNTPPVILIPLAEVMPSAPADIPPEKVEVEFP